MASSVQGKTARAIVGDVLSRKMANEIWSYQYDKALPITTNDFDLSAILPAVFYMFRFGNRRGRGGFLKTFASGDKAAERKRSATVERIATELGSRPDLRGFDDDVTRAVLGDLLLCSSLENKNRALGRDQQVQRVSPTHYMSSWIDLPDSLAHLRHVPEMMVAILAKQDGDHVVHSDPGTRTWFPVAMGHEENLLLRAFSQGTTRQGRVSDLNADRFDERNDVIGVDQLLMIRLAQQVGSAPYKAAGKGSDKISNQRPISEQAATHFSDDIRRFVRAYAEIIPRNTFVEMLESCIATGMTAILSSVVEILTVWSDSGDILPKNEQQPASVFVDCSNGIDPRLRALAEQSFDDLVRRLERIPVILMMLRLLDYVARDNRRIKSLDIPTRPYADQWLTLLGSLLHERHEEAPYIHRLLDDQAEKLAVQLEGTFPEVVEILRNERSQADPIRRLATALTALLGTSVRSNFMGMVDSVLHVGRPNGLAKKRTTTRGAQVTRGGRRRREVRSLVLTDSVLEYLVHLNLLRSGNKMGVRRLSLKAFLDVIRERYGFHVDAPPPGMMISNELLQENRATLERRLRDLGLLAGVNDAEAMKRLQPRFVLK